MLEIYRDGDAPPQSRTPALKPKLRSWTGPGVALDADAASS